MTTQKLENMTEEDFQKAKQAGDLDCAKAIAESLGIKWEKKDLGEILEAYSRKGAIPRGADPNYILERVNPEVNMNSLKEAIGYMNRTTFRSSMDCDPAWLKYRK